MIDLDNLVQLHDNKETIRRHKRILEELFYLCINESFNNTVADARRTIFEMMSNTGIEFPIDNISTAIELRNTHLANNEEYQTLLVSIGERHNYYHPSFTRDYSRVSSDSTTFNRFNILENILLLNNPLPDISQDTREHFSNKSGYMEIAVDEKGPFISMHFDLGTTKKEIQDIIDKLFRETADIQESRYMIPNARYTPEKNLKIKSIIHKETSEGANDTQISITLEDEGLYDEDSTGDSVRMQKTRMNRNAARFNAND